MIVQIAFNPRVLGEFRFDPFHARLLGRTLFYNALVATLASMMAIPAALIIGRGRGWLARLTGFILPLPLLFPSITYAYGWSQALRLLDLWRERHFPNWPSLYPLPASAGDVMRCVWTLATWLWPLPAGIIGLSLRRIDANLQQQALLDGAYWRITLRQLLGPAVAGWCIVAVLAMQEFSVYEPTGISVVATEVRAVFDTGVMNLSPQQMQAINNPGVDGGGGGVGVEFPQWDPSRRAAAALATGMPLLLLIGCLAGVAVWSARRFTAAERVDAGDWPRSLDARWASLFGAMAMLGVTVVVPAGCMVASLKRPADAARIWQTFNPQVLGSILNASLAGIIAFILAMLACVQRSRAATALGLITFLIGGQLLAIAEIRLYNHRSLGWIYNAPPIVVMAYLARFGWVALLAGQGTWSRPWRELREVAAIDGADDWQTARHVIWPMVAPIAMAAGVLVMTLSLTEVPATVLLAPQRPPTLVPLLMTWVHTLRSDDMLEASLLLMFATVALGAIALCLARLGRRFMAIAITCLALCILAPGCGKSSEPKEIWLETGASDGQVVYPRGIAYSPHDDTFFVVDRMARVQHFDRDGKFLNGWRMPEFGLGKPVGLSVGPDDNLYVPDTHYHRVIVYTPKGEELRRFGSLGTQPGQFIYPTDLAFDEKGNLFVSEYGDHDRIQVFDPLGHFLYQFGRFGQGDGEFSRPQSMLIDDGLVYITDACNHRICVFKTDGAWVRNMGKLGSGPGELRFPYGLDQDREGHLIVCEFGNNRVQKLDKITGRSLGTWGSGGREPGQLAYPWGVIVDRKDRVIAVDSGNNRLQVFGF
jgi:ABC-type Fe3+ transport system permease subunit/DNA-binding beta-propeller fold protein YncE